jgi:hypothetical protein
MDDDRQGFAAIRQDEVDDEGRPLRLGAPLG